MAISSRVSADAGQGYLYPDMQNLLFGVMNAGGRHTDGAPK